jgi:hypothetical protein
MVSPFLEPFYHSAINCARFGGIDVTDLTQWLVSSRIKMSGGERWETEGFEMFGLFAFECGRKGEMAVWSVAFLAGWIACDVLKSVVLKMAKGAK